MHLFFNVSPFRTVPVVNKYYRMFSNTNCSKIDLYFAVFRTDTTSWFTEWNKNLYKVQLVSQQVDASEVATCRMVKQTRLVLLPSNTGFNLNQKLITYLCSDKLLLGQIVSLQPITYKFIVQLGFPSKEESDFKLIHVSHVVWRHFSRHTCNWYLHDYWDTSINYPHPLPQGQDYSRTSTNGCLL